MSWIVSIILLVMLIILYLKLQNKKAIDKKEQYEYEQQVKKLIAEHSTLAENIRNKESQLSAIEEKTKEAEQEYRTAIFNKSNDLNKYFESLKVARQREMDEDFEHQRAAKEEALDAIVKQITKEKEELAQQVEQAADQVIKDCTERAEKITEDTNFLQSRYESLVAPLKQYEMDKQQRLYYTIQVPDEYKEDINFLITEVSQRVQHPDIINKLVWSEYVKPYIDDTFKRVGIEDKCGIYKITNIDSGKGYIGKSTNIKKRIADHIKSSIGIKSIADQVVHHEIWKTGFWNWTLEPIIYCDKDKLNELEKYYIDFFKTQDYGYNRNAGGGG